MAKEISLEELEKMSTKERELIYSGALTLLNGYSSGFKYAGIGFAQDNSLQKRCVYAAANLAKNCGLIKKEKVQGTESVDADPSADAQTT